MSLFDPQNTLAYHLSRPLTSHVDMSHVKCKAVAKAVQAFQKADKHATTRPESEALWFYGLNHGMALLAAKRAPHEPLPRDELAFVEDYHKLLGPKAIRAFYYMLLICTRESRHNKSLNKDAKKIAAMFGKPVADFHMSIEGGESSIHQAFMQHPPDATIGQYVEAMEWAFFNSKWSGGYGGPKWGNVNQCMTRFVKGEFTAEMMLDTVWTLAHNGGPIFNKGMLYAHWSQELIRILDVQRSGQIPEMIYGDDPSLGKLVEPTLDGKITWMKEQFPEKIGHYVDWYVVEALGSVNKYPKDKQLQVAKHGMSPLATAAEKQAAEKKAAIEKAAAEKKANWEKNHFQVLPGLDVEKVHRKTAA